MLSTVMMLVLVFAVLGLLLALSSTTHSTDVPRVQFMTTISDFRCFVALGESEYIEVESAHCNDDSEPYEYFDIVRFKTGDFADANSTGRFELLNGTTYRSNP
jgi:hypothetical protein